MRSKCGGRVILSMGLAMLGVLLLLTQLSARHATAQPPAQRAIRPGGRTGSAWPLTADGRSRFAGWSPDGRTVLVNRWGAVVGDGTTCQALSELWAVSLPLHRGKGREWGFRGDPSTGSGRGPAIRLSENAVQPAYTGDGQRLAYLAFAGDGRWEARVLDLTSGQEKAWGSADWRMAPAWVSGALAFARAGQVWLSSEGAMAVPAAFPTLLAGAQVRLTADGVRAAWSNGTHLWVAPRPGGEPRLLAANVQVLNFAWSPDGRRLAYVIAAKDLSPALWVADVDYDEDPVFLARGQAETFSTPGWSPDGRTLAFSRTPLGATTASASDIWLVNADGEDLRPLLRNDLEESNPAWSPDGRYLTFNRAGDVWVLDLTHPLSTASSPHEEHRRGSLFTNLPIYQSTTVQQTPPVTIRVIHSAENYYRYDVPVGQIDVITFETYVKRAVPVEMPASWSIEALKVQAVAARTYAWYYTKERAGLGWDVSDWTDYQVMGREDQRHTRSDAATDDTRGQYIAYQGNVIKAFYSAENGCPTRSAAGYDYIQAVDDPVSFGQERRGHGWGMSQWGARRWAEWHGWGYQQILAHYYTNVTIELPSTGGPMPIGGVTLPWSDFFITSNRVCVVANGSDETGNVAAVGFYAMTDTTALLVTDTLGSDGWSTVWDVAGISDTTSMVITLSLLVADGEGNVQLQCETVHIGLDRRPPTATTAAIGDTYTDTITVTLSSLSAADPDPGSGVQMMAFSNEGWAWEGEDLYHEGGTGEQVDDEDALNGKAWRGLTGTHSAGAWYGPYTYDLPPGHAYRAYFRLKTNNVITTAEIAMLDVVDNGGARILGLRRLRGTDLSAADTYQEFPVDFNYTDAGTAGLEFRTAFRSTADLYLDRVLIVGYPISVATSVQWRLTPGEGLKTVTVKFIDGAGNVSADLTRTVMLSDTSPPTGWRDFAPEWWSGGNPPTCTVRILDEISGLNVDSACYRFSTDGGASWSDWLVATCTDISGTTEMQTITAPSVPFGGAQGKPFGWPRETANRIEFQIADMKGYTSTAIYTVRSRILYLPLVMKP
ncbi:MAG: SpoIID/LytB domain-containing protein [Anaerolineae bacterium]|nr:SpoIID/LytB domain-containing protein [Anaerolineae bacterium]